MADELKAYLQDKGLAADPGTLSLLLGYMEAVLLKNRTLNLTAVTEEEDFVEKHLIDSLSLTAFPAFKQAQTVLDLGTGAGLPGVPLAILAPDKAFLLLDAVGKKLRAVEEIAAGLGLTNVTCLHARAEDAGRQKVYRETKDLVVSRAVANLSVLSEYCLPLVKPGGWFVAYKTQAAAEEIRQAQGAVKLLGGGKMELVASDRPGSDHLLVFIPKIQATPPAYPRKAGDPGRKPL